MDTRADRPHVRLPADVSHRRRRGGDRRGAGQRRLGGDPRAVLGARVLGRHRALRLHAVPVYRRAVPLPGATRRRIRTRREHRAAAGLRQRPAARHLGRVQDAASAFRRSSSSTRATEGNVTMFNFEGKAGRRRPHAVVRRAPLPDRGGALRRRDASSRCATREGFCIAARRTKSGEAIGKIVNDPSKPGDRFEGYADARPRPRGRSCATCSRRATPGSAPAT